MKALEELLESAIIDKIPNIIAVQSEYCDPFAKALFAEEKHTVKVTPKPTMERELLLAYQCAARKF
ncbi:hypothetical protein I6U48_23280 [Clostridium sp. PL3]|uniref:Uncharacterized protein n=1 Tax=Clostridium thailandense TaxID=2794346 RepID=A0A949WXD6_9CLOT|nr:hypothetical protein [Clostridium thailandense]MBV7275827.1 hypothetical protein [Clostridium thailandense]